MTTQVSLVAELLRDGMEDLVRQDEVYAWVEFDGDSLDFVNNPNLEVAEWLACLINDVGMGDAIFGSDDWCSDFIPTACLRRGIAPGQPFLVRFWGYWYSFDDYSRESDDGSECEIVYVEPITAVEAARRWHLWIDGDIVAWDW